uniref:Uncharacterized protein n=1 Tax=Picea glauca TaxID=3330 RepID=A0A117NI29_PICGL|nr:hypothetical protein ABT39_MTgene3861 [Picea glauca]QHR86133.1 hypothetical protein Q903MT_gene132 [Picea sitchensis]
MPRLSYILTYPCPATLFPIAGSEVTFHASPQAIPANSTPTGQEFRIWYQSLRITYFTCLYEYTPWPVQSPMAMEQSSGTSENYYR